MQGPPEVRLVVSFESAPRFELHADGDEALDRLLLWLAAPRTRRHLAKLVALLTSDTVDPTSRT